MTAITDPLSTQRPHGGSPPLQEHRPGTRVGKSPSSVHLKVQARTSQPWEVAFEHQRAQSESGQWPGKQLVTLMRGDHYLGHSIRLSQLLPAILEDAVEALQAQRGCLVLMDEVTGELQVQAAVSRRRKDLHAKQFSRTLAQQSFDACESILCQDTSTEDTVRSASSILTGSMASVICAVVRSPRQRLGVLHLDRGPLQEPFTEEQLHLADTIAARAALGIEGSQLFEQLQTQFLQTLHTLVRAVETRDPFTGSHSQRVTDYALLLANHMRLSDEEIELLRVGAPLHDIGKIGIPDSILCKPGKLTAEEYAYMQLHPLKGVDILQPFPALHKVLPIIRHHHERWDGRGYPDRLGGENIPRVARVMAVADVFDALTSARPYRKAMPTEQAFQIIQQESGAMFDPRCVAAFLAVRPCVEAIQQDFASREPSTLAQAWESLSVGQGTRSNEYEARSMVCAN